MQLPRLLWAYRCARRLRFADRAALQAHQTLRWERHARVTLVRSPYFAPWVGRPLAEWPMMDKPLMMANFDQMNTAGLHLAEVLACALGAEHSRDFRGGLGAISVGLSSGTSGGRGVFAVSAAERAAWAGVMLARMLPGGLFQRERVALFLRADSQLYRTVRTPWLRFAFFDLFEPIDSQLDALERLQPSILVAPAQVLRALALAQQAGRVRLRPTRLISVAEVLEPQDRALLGLVFGRVDQVYQATEGFLGSTCERGTLHLNEEFLHVEPQWLDADRFVPIITDFTRTTQPIVRYRLDDILVREREPCGCGRPTLSIARIEGRCDDLLRLPGVDGREVEVFADVVHRALARALPLGADYRLEQTGRAALSLWTAPADDPLRRQAIDGLAVAMRGLGVKTDTLSWSHPDNPPPADFTIKRRRVRRVHP